MNYNPRIISVPNQERARQELLNIGCDTAGRNIMSAKAVFKVIRVEQVKSKAALILKQTFLAKGGEVSVTRGAADLSSEYTDVMISATLKQYRLAIQQLKAQPWGLSQLSDDLAAVLAADETFPARQYEWPRHRLTIEPKKTLVMGILNLTPDSFSDGGRFNSFDAALRHAEAMIAAGADIIDIGAESTRPYGSETISAAEEMERLLPVLEKVLAVSSVPVSVDTYKASVAEAALKLGVHMINDIWGLQKDPDMAAVVARYKVPVCIMHNQDGTEYAKDIMAEICGFLRRSMEIGTAAGIESKYFIVDPGIGFGKVPTDNLVVMARMEELRSLGCPVLLGTSRKRFIGEALQLPPEQRVEGTGATVALGITKGAHIVRVHDVEPIVRICKMMDAMKCCQA
ncbi:MAG TPA: dihydropteroate synthase [Patescibacteria group bacterium]|nr:dihydropteroate synthase [Patescibacteria group bacterium]